MEKGAAHLMTVIGPPNSIKPTPYSWGGHGDLPPTRVQISSSSISHDLLVSLLLNY